MSWLFVVVRADALGSTARRYWRRKLFNAGKFLIEPDSRGNEDAIAANLAKIALAGRMAKHDMLECVRATSVICLETPGKQNGARSALRQLAG